MAFQLGAPRRFDWCSTLSRDLLAKREYTHPAALRSGHDIPPATLPEVPPGRHVLSQADTCATDDPDLSERVK